MTMLKPIRLSLLLLLCALPLCAAAPVEKTAQDAKSELSALRREYDSLYEKTLVLRAKLIRTTPELTALHDEIAEKQQLLADKLAENKEVAAQTAKLAELESKMKTLEKSPRK